MGEFDILNSMKRWSTIFKILGNINRLKIIKLLSEKREMCVVDIAKKLEISQKSTSKHLILLSRMDILEYKGQAGHVYYSMNGDMPTDLKNIINLFL